MSASPSQVRAASAAKGTRVPSRAAARRFRSCAVPDLAPSPWQSWKLWTPEALQGWAGSVSLHVLLLLVLACWYFAPRSKGPAAFDSRLAGSPHGIPEAESLTGGLNTRFAHACRTARNGRVNGSVAFGDGTHAH